MTAAKKKPSLYEAEFQRFEDGHLYTIKFDQYGTIESGSIYIYEMDMPGCNGEIDVTAFVKADEYWQKRVDQWLAEKTDVMTELRLFKQGKE